MTTERAFLTPVLAVCAILFATSAFAQRQGRTEVRGAVAVNQLVEKHVEFNERVKTMPGYRIQIASFSGANSRTSAFATKERFLESFPEVEVYLVFDEPNFKVKVGDFTTKLEAFAFLQKIKLQFPGVIIKDNIYPIRLNWDSFVPETDEDAEN